MYLLSNFICSFCDISVLLRNYTTVNATRLRVKQKAFSVKLFLLCGNLEIFESVGESGWNVFFLLRSAQLIVFDLD